MADQGSSQSLWSLAAKGFTKLVVESGVAAAAGDAVVRSIKRMALQTIPPSELGLAQLSARLADLTYAATTPEAVSAGLATLLGQPSLIWFQEQEQQTATSQWFLAHGVLPRGVGGPGGRALFLVFRGTQTVSDVMHDVMARPKAAASNGKKFHEGFLRAVENDAVLLAQLRQHAAGDVPLYVLGHSLGGSLALTLWGAGLLPPSHAGRVTVVALGSPAVHHGPAQLSAAQQRARVLVVVNGADAVPRLLGSPLATTKAVLGRFLDLSEGRGRDTARAVEALEQYTHPPQLELVYLKEGSAYRVAYQDRMDVLHLVEGLSASAVEDHLTYNAALERCTGAAAWDARAAARPPRPSSPPPPPPPPPDDVPMGVPVREEDAVPMGVPVSMGEPVRGEPVPGAAAGGLPEASSMKVRELKAELEARGVPTATLLEKVELVEALQRARREGRPR